MNLFHVRQGDKMGADMIFHQSSHHKICILGGTTGPNISPSGLDMMDFLKTKVV